MLICKKDNAHYINIHLEIIPSFIEVIEGDNVYKFSVENENVGASCPKEAKIKQWIGNNYKKLEDIIWEWNIGNDEVPLIEDVNF